jgi:hypothetical protein
MSILSKLFQHVPRNHFKLPTKDFKCIHTYTADNETYEIFQHTNTRVQVIVNVDSQKVVNIKAGRFQIDV